MPTHKPFEGAVTLVVAVLAVACEPGGRAAATNAAPTASPASASAPWVDASPGVDASRAPQNASDAHDDRPDAEVTVTPRTPRTTNVNVTGAPIDVDPGESIAHVELGMKRSYVQALGIRLAPEGVARVDRTGWVSGPLLVLFDPSDRVVLVSVELGKSQGLNVGGRAVPRTASLAQIASLVPGCTKGVGSGGEYLDCRGSSGKLVHFWGTGGSKEITVTLDAALLR